MEVLINIGIGLIIGLMINVVLTIKDMRKTIRDSIAYTPRQIGDKNFYTLTEEDFVKFLLYDRIISDSDFSGEVEEFLNSLDDVEVITEEES